MRALGRSLVVASFVLCGKLASASGFEIAGYGDSLTGESDLKWCGHVQAPHSCDWTYAVPGEQAAVGAARLIEDLQAGLVDPSTTHVTLAWGANDIRQGGLDWEAEFQQPLRDAATAVRAAGFEPVLVVTLDQYQTSPGQSPDECDPYPELEARLESELSPRIYELAGEFDPPILVADLNAAYDEVPDSVKCPGAWNVGYYRDHVHQTDAGYQFMADAIIGAMEAQTAPVVPAMHPMTLYVLLPGLLGGAALMVLRRRRVG